MATNFLSVFAILITLTPIITNRCQQWKLDDHTMLVQTNIGIDIFVDGKDRGICKIIRESGMHHGELIQFMKKFVADDLGFVHVGAHIGIQVLAIAKYAADNKVKNFHIYAFEPSELNYILLTKSIYLNNLQANITLYKAAITNISGTAQLAIRNVDTSLADIVPGAVTKRKADYKYEVKTVGIDDGLGQQIGRGDRFGLIYLSCNSFEIQAMLGMKNMLNHNKDVTVLMQWSFAKIGHKDVDGLIQSLNYFKNNSYRLFVVNLNKQPAISTPYTEIINFIEITKLNQSLLLFVPMVRVGLLGIQ